MKRTTTPRRRTPAKTDLSPRAMLLAGLGAVSLGRKQCLKSIDGLADAGDSLRQRADAAARDASHRVAKFRKQAKARLAPVQKQASAFATKAQSEFESRFAPLLVKLGAQPTRAKRTAKRPAKRSVRPAAKRAAKRA